MPKLPQLPQLLSRKIYKTGQTRGADDDVIFQNRVNRNSTVLIPYSSWSTSFSFPEGETGFENGFIVLISPNDYASHGEEKLKEQSLIIGENLLVFYETREQWLKYIPEKFSWQPAEKRIAPLGGQYVARISATTATEDGGKIVHGFTTTSGKGAGIRVFEYASSETISKCRLQLEALYWLCKDSEDIVTSNGMKSEEASLRKEAILGECKNLGLLDLVKLQSNRIVNTEHRTICPFCLEELSSAGFFNKMHQALGREVHDLTVTELNLFHVEELRVGIYGHRPYNLGWGHHHCNVVVKDSGIGETLKWMAEVLKRNADRDL